MAYYKAPGKNKYGAKKKKYRGVIYDSQLEADFAAKLDILKKAEDPSERVTKWIGQYRLDLCVGGTKWRSYKIDFRVVKADGWIEYIEAKGFPTRDWKMKWDMTIILFDKLTEGENARLYLNSQLIKTSYK